MLVGLTEFFGRKRRHFFTSTDVSFWLTQCSVQHECNVDECSKLGHIENLLLDGSVMVVVTWPRWRPASPDELGHLASLGLSGGSSAHRFALFVGSCVQRLQGYTAEIPLPAGVPALLAPAAR